MPTQKYTDFERHSNFFLLNLSHDNLVNHYRTNFELMYSHNYSLTELENMIPWEREIYITMLTQRVKEENELRNQQNG
jgi:hypothetical protein